MGLNGKAYFMENLPGLLRLIRIPSVYDPETAAPGRPYGQPVADALNFMRDLALRDGFEVEEYDGHAVAVCLGGQARRIDVASHLDVVEPGEGWTVDPFCGEVRDGRLYGRGSQDMKTSAFLTYLALKRIREEQLPLTRGLRLVFGADEERTMDDMAYYLKQAGPPDFAFTPDGAFPMAIGEKGALMWRLSGRYDGLAEELDGGVQCNVISPAARAVLKPGTDGDAVARELKRLGLDGSVDAADGKTVVTVRGKAAHASRPAEGHSATVDLLRLLGSCGDETMEALFRCFADPRGAGIGLTGQGENGYTMNLGIFRIHNGDCCGEVDARYPFGLTSAACTELLRARCPLAVSLDYDSPPTMNDLADPFVGTLLAAYRDLTGDMREPFVSGGVSYSKVFGHCVAFGPLFPGGRELIHQADESVDLSDAADAFEIYYEAMKRLAQLERKDESG